MSEILQTPSGGSFSVSQIPLEQQQKVMTNYDTDKIKILELSNIIDKWEEQVLFSEGGYFSLKGKEIENKSKEFITELSEFIGGKIQDCAFENIEAKNTAIQIKNEKISAILEKMKIYEYRQMQNWEISVYEEAISSCLKRAVLYKNDNDVVQKAFLNGISVLNIMAEKENWNNKIIKAKLAEYRSDFYYAIIKAFMDSRDLNACKYYSKYKDVLFIDNKDELEKSLEMLKENIISYNLAKEIFSYNLDEREQKIYIEKIDDENIKKKVKKYIKDFKDTKEKEKRTKEKEEKEQNWQTVMSSFANNPDTAFIDIDYSLPEEHISAVKTYIEKRKNSRYIETDKNRFVGLIKEMFENYQAFSEKDISGFRADLSQEDFDIFEKFQKMNSEDFYCLYSDYKYSCKKLSEINMFDIEEQYEYAKLYLKLLNEYGKNSEKKADIKVRNDIINTVLQRFMDNKPVKNEIKKQDKKE